jgi:hypothetical protein
MRTVLSPVLALAIALGIHAPAVAQVARAQITRPVNDGELQTLPQNTHPLAKPEFDRGPAPASLGMQRLLLVLRPSAEHQQALNTFLQEVHDPTSPTYHHWLTPAQFGQRFGAADTDIQQISSWLTSHGLQVNNVSNGRTVIEFSGTAANVQSAFHTAIHSYLVNGVQHWANASDPQIPAALVSVVAGVASLHSFRKAPQIANLKAQVAQIQSRGKRAQFTIGSGDYALAPADFETIYNVNPAYASGITGTGATIAVVARTNIKLTDISDFRSSFGLSANLPQVVVNGPDPGDIGSGDEAEAVLDTSWSGALAPNATVKLVVSGSTATTDGVDLSEEYIVNNNLADVMTESYGDCEANYTAAEAQFYSSLAQQAAAQGITYTVAAGDSGAEGCDDPSSKITATGPVSVNILAATPYDVAVGGTQFNEHGADSTYWTATNNSLNASALSYIPENAWNEACTVAQCGSSNAGIWAGSGGVSTLFTKPSWQSGVAGIPSDGMRDVPDISMTSAGHDFYLICLAGSCTVRRGQSYFSGVSGTSAATPSFAGIMALVVQYTGARQGQADTKLYSLAASQPLAICNASSTGTPPDSTCIFNDVNVGNNAVPGQSDYGLSNARYQAGVGYDLATGLGSVNVSNLVFGWNGGGTTPRLRIGIDTPGLYSTIMGTSVFSGWAIAESRTVSTVKIAIDNVPFGAATYGTSRPEVCAAYPGAAGCPNVGWYLSFDSTLLPNGPHTVDVTATSSAGQTYTASSNFTIANWESVNPIKMFIDSPSSGATVSGAALLNGWAIDTQSSISSVSIAVDGVSYGAASYGNNRQDVCNSYPGEAACPNVGWTSSLNTSSLSEGIHTLAITAAGADGEKSTTASTFRVVNTPNNTITIGLDLPNARSGPISGYVGLAGWAIGTTVPINAVAITIDGVSYGAATYGVNRSDVCVVFPGRPSCPNVGWQQGFDTTQLVNGTHLFSVTASTVTGQRTSQSTVFTVNNSASANPVSMFTDVPGYQSSIVADATTFRGWAVSSSSAIARVSVAIDSAPSGTVTYGSGRGDVCAVYPGPSCPNVGWSLPYDTTQLANGTHTITVTAGDSSGHVGTKSEVFTVANWSTNNPMKLFIDIPSAQSGALSGLTPIAGWAIDSIAPIIQLSVSVDGLPYGNANIGQTRGDVCVAYPNSVGCPNVGWNYEIDTTLFPDGMHTISVTGTTIQGQSSTFAATFETANAAATPIRAYIDVPAAMQTITGISTLQGWALSADGAALQSVEVLADGVLKGAVNYAANRADVCAVYPGGSGCPNVGWAFNLDTTPLANGSHSLEVRVITSAGRQYTYGKVVSVANQP